MVREVPLVGRAAFIFPKKSANPIRFFDYAAKKWVTLGE
jgi:hypothetical protein